jgi:hypothetical protein
MVVVNLMYWSCTSVPRNAGSVSFINLENVRAFGE